ncbi:hypothetical protein LTS10_010443 [Elasticomyces elasticus]|nr:hypothetical protein LTS10_010443 [Elasticomyces elasticus]
MASSVSANGFSLEETDAVGGAADAQHTGTTPTLDLLEQSDGKINGVCRPADVYYTPTLNLPHESNGDIDTDPEASDLTPLLDESNTTQPQSPTTQALSLRQTNGLRPKPPIKPLSLAAPTTLPGQTNGLPGPSRRLVAQKLARGVDKIQATRLWSQSRSTRPQVCHRCALLKLTFESFVVDDDAQISALGRPSFQGKRGMGTYSEIKGRAEHMACELCQLLVKSLDNRPAASSETLQTNGSARCELFWRVDGRETVRAEEAVSPRTVKRTRRLAIEWTANGTTYEPSYIVLIAPDGCFLPDGTVNPLNKQGANAGKSTFFLGRKLTSLEFANTQLVKKCSTFRDLQTQACFTVLDVKRMMLSELPEGAEYVALSYTWGPPDNVTATPRFKVTDSNVLELEQENGVGAVLHKLPVAIQNAIALTRYLGFDYVWIDSLCIIQGNADSWNANARLMDVIYGYAELTICAADGDGANVGLEALYSSGREHRVSHRPGADQQVIVKYPTHGSDQDYLELMLSWPSEVYVACSRWNSRAWTFQERMLSPRCLICVSQRVYFQCKTTTMSEDIYSDVKTEKGSAGWSVELKGAPAQTFKRLDVDPVNVYKDCLRMYTSRQLSDESDILSALDGIGKAVCEGLTCLNRENVDEGALLFGLPASHFDFALLWQPKEVAERRCLESTFFPSWSWSGWKCGTGMTYRPAAVAAPELNLHEWLTRHTWITYYIRDSRGHLRLVWDPTCQDEIREFRDRWKGYESPGGGWPSSSNLEITVDLHGRPWNDRLPTRGRLHENGGGPGQQDKQFDHRLHAFRAKPRILAPGAKKAKGRDMPFIQFYTWWGRFYVDGEEEDDVEFSTHGLPQESVGNGLKRYTILDRHGDFAGVIVLDEGWSLHHPAGEPQEFIAISRARAFDEDERGSHGLYTEEDEDGSKPWQLYNVLMIVRDDKNKKPHEGDTVAYRRGLGKMYRQAFEHSCPDVGSDVPLANQWREILLG